MSSLFDADEYSPRPPTLYLQSITTPTHAKIFIMHILFLPFFTVILLLRITPFILRLAINRLLSYKSLIIFVFIFSVAGIIFSTHLSAVAKKEHRLDVKEKLIQQKNSLESLLEKQPTHKDILLNLANINKALGDEQQSTYLRNKALSLDPNNNSF
ncbi:MAG: hypothetical protein HN846_03510 [Candidatus Pacebacteria bacterium]|jgi:hypothetical protein|nr:hypothetical protein [Candidatus Paceibacterota bacterium]MBT3512115.1 hypothetical protein [Candidatus Paceibacterota bacterium]MBT4005423.1 hypothetical protein [Candidatus Paceibacterota bacterium]MBT4359132.1 hypothetical protein [Candidatus Paceibacterota bacterium]MBT4680951.1 hypothetical protein [Candidatus Paceibacterota bacterium]